MKDWIRDNIGKVITATALLFSVVGFVADRFIMQNIISNDLKTLQKLHQQDYDYTMKMLRASGAFYEEIIE